MIADDQMHRVELICMVDNARSRAVAERLGFTLEGIKRESEWINGAFRDHALYSLLAHEWHV
jgi:ribosomal-protein-serine acetyltransferase